MCLQSLSGVLLPSREKLSFTKPRPDAVRKGYDHRQRIVDRTWWDPAASSVRRWTRHLAKSPRRDWVLRKLINPFTTQTSL